jgi:hypothetical protein
MVILVFVAILSLGLLAAPDGSYAAISGGIEFIGAPFQFVEADDGRITMVMFGELEFPKLD